MRPRPSATEVLVEEPTLTGAASVPLTRTPPWSVPEDDPLPMLHRSDELWECTARWANFPGCKEEGRPTINSRRPSRLLRSLVCNKARWELSFSRAVMPVAALPTEDTLSSGMMSASNL